MADLTVVDTDILIDVGREVSEAIDYLDELENRTTLAVSVVTQMELIVGCRNKAELRGEQFRFILRRVMQQAEAGYEDWPLVA